MSHEIEIEGYLNVPRAVNLDSVVKAFMTFAECRGWYFEGHLQEFKDDHYEQIDIREED